MTNPFFQHRDGQLYCENVPLSEIADEHGTPTYVYSSASIRASFSELDSAFGGLSHKVCYSVKANPNLSVCSLLAGLGAGADVTSGGELFRALKAGFQPDDIVFAGVGKSEREMAEALDAGISLFSVESLSELRALSRVTTRQNACATVSLRVNPNVDARTHPHITTGLSENKFGVAIEDAPYLYELAASLPGIRIGGVGMHIGSQMVNLAPMGEAARSLLALASDLMSRGHRLRYFDIGGGFGISYGEESPENPRDVIFSVDREAAELGLTVLTEPGRRLVGPAGVLLLRVLYRKQTALREFIIVDGGMNVLMRPALYGARHRAVAIREDTGTTRADLVGPVCESTDTFIKGGIVPDVHEGELLAIMDCGAYGFAMASEYNGRPKPAEVLVDGSRFWPIRRRQSYESMIADETV